MCYRNCPYENYDGECTVGQNIPDDAYCLEDIFADEDLADDFED